MDSIYNYLNLVYWNLKQKNSQQTLAVILVLLTIPLPYWINSLAIAIFVLSIILNQKNNSFVWIKILFLPIMLYVLMLLSVFWSYDINSTINALSKELSLLIVPFCFLFFFRFSKENKQTIIKFYSYGIVVFAAFYLLRAITRYLIYRDIKFFFYHGENENDIGLVPKLLNAIHFSVYVGLAFFYFFIKQNKKIYDYFFASLLFTMVFLLSSKNIIVVFIALIMVYELFYTKMSHKLRLKNIIIFGILLLFIPFIGQIKDRFRIEYETMMTDSSVNDVIGKDQSLVYNVSIKQAWNQKTFRPNDFFPGTAFRVYQFRIFLEMLHEDAIFWTGYGLNASYPRIAQKGIEHKLFLGDKNHAGYQTKNFHNQYVQNFAELGFFGLLILIAMVVINLRNAIKNKDFIHISFAVLMISLFLSESFLWRQRGVVFFSLMFCLFNMPTISKTKNEL